MRNKLLSYFVTIAVIIGYLVSSFGICWHIAEENKSHPNCSACNETASHSNIPSFNESCSDFQDCHNPQHHHHNHPIHDSDNCQICHTAFSNKITHPDTEFVISPQNNCVKLFCITEIIISQTTFTAESIRGPPSVS
jgi:hypothetical protein